MASPVKRRLKSIIIRWELHWYALTVLTYAVAIALLFAVFPDVSNLWVSVFVLVSGFTSAVAAAASAIKSSDTTD